MKYTFFLFLIDSDSIDHAARLVFDKIANWKLLERRETAHICLFFFGYGAGAIFS